MIRVLFNIVLFIFAEQKEKQTPVCSQQTKVNTSVNSDSQNSSIDEMLDQNSESPIPETSDQDGDFFNEIIEKENSATPCTKEIETSQVTTKSIFASRKEKLKAALEKNGQKSATKRTFEDYESSKKGADVIENSSGIKQPKKIVALQENKSLLNTEPKFLLVKPTKVNSDGTSQPPIKVQLISKNRINLLKKNVKQMQQTKVVEKKIDLTHCDGDSD